MESDAPHHEIIEESPYKDDEKLVQQFEIFVPLFISIFWVGFLTILTLVQKPEEGIFIRNWYYGGFFLLVSPFVLEIWKIVILEVVSLQEDSEFYELMVSFIFFTSFTVTLIAYPFRLDSYFDWKFAQKYHISLDFILKLVLFCFIIIYGTTSYVRFRRFRGTLPTN